MTVGVKLNHLITVTTDIGPDIKIKSSLLKKQYCNASIYNQ